MSFLRRLFVFLAGNVLAQGLAAVTGLLLVRWLPVEQYAYYTIAISIMGGISVLAKGGANIGFVAILGRNWPDYVRAGELVPALAHVRRLLMICLMPVVLGLAALLLWRSGIGWVGGVSILVLLALFWVADLNSRIVDQILFFARQTSRVQMLDSALAIGRLGVVSALFVLGGLTAVTAVAVGVLVALARIKPIRSWVFALLPKGVSAPRPEDVEEIVAGVKRQLPVEAFYVSQMQIVLLLLSFRADAAVIAGFGALMRFDAILGPIRTVTQAFFVPVAAKARKRAVTTILGLTGLVGLLVAPLIVIAVFAPNSLLWLLGNKYSDLQSELLVAVFCVAFIQIGDQFWHLISHRGWAEYAHWQILIRLFWVVLGVNFLDLSSISGALILNAGFSSSGLIIGALELIRHRGETGAPST